MAFKLENKLVYQSLSGTAGLSKEWIQQQFTLVQCVEDDKKKTSKTAAVCQICSGFSTAS